MASHFVSALNRVSDRVVSSIATSLRFDSAPSECFTEGQKALLAEAFRSLGHAFGKTVAEHISSIDTRINEQVVRITAMETLHAAMREMGSELRPLRSQNEDITAFMQVDSSSRARKTAKNKARNLRRKRARDKHQMLRDSILKLRPASEFNASSGRTIHSSPGCLHGCEPAHVGASVNGTDIGAAVKLGKTVVGSRRFEAPQLTSQRRRTQEHVQTVEKDVKVTQSQTVEEVITLPLKQVFEKEVPATQAQVQEAVRQSPASMSAEATRLVLIPQTDVDTSAMVLRNVPSPEHEEKACLTESLNTPCTPQVENVIVGVSSTEDAVWSQSDGSCPEHAEKLVEADGKEVTEAQDLLLGPGRPPRTTTPPGKVGRGSDGDSGSGEHSSVQHGHQKKFVPSEQINIIASDWSPWTFIELRDTGQLSATCRSNFFLVAERTLFYEDSDALSSLFDDNLDS